MTCTILKMLAQEKSFAATYIMDAGLAQDAPLKITTLVLLLYPYDSWGEAAHGCARISTYYFAAQDAYRKAKEMVFSLNQEGDSALLCNDVRLKPLLSRLKDFTQGRNSLHYHKEYGSRFNMQVIGLTAQLPVDENILRQKEESTDMCGSCIRCISACPANAITDKGFQRDRCLRQHMLEASPVPEHLRTLMENRLVGCDNCQQVCPYNANLPNGETAGEWFLIDELLKQEKDVLTRLANKIGRNMARINRILAQACITAGNSKEQAHLSILKELCHHPSSTVAEHAKWAVNILSNETKETTT